MNHSTSTNVESCININQTFSVFHPNCCILRPQNNESRIQPQKPQNIENQNWHDREERKGTVENTFPISETGRQYQNGNTFMGSEDDIQRFFQGISIEDVLSGIERDPESFAEDLPQDLSRFLLEVMDLRRVPYHQPPANFQQDQLAQTRQMDNTGNNLFDVTMETEENCKITARATMNIDIGFGVSEAKDDDLISFLTDFVKDRDARSIKILTLELAACQHLEDVGLAILGSILGENFGNLRELTINLPQGISNMMKDDEKREKPEDGIGKMILSICTNLKDLKALSLFFSYCSINLMTKLGEGVKTLDNLTNLSLNFPHAGISDNHLSILRSFLIQMKGLTKLTLNLWGGLSISNRAIEEITKILSNFPKLSDLKLYFAFCLNVTKTGITLLEDCIVKNLKSLKSLVLDFCGCEIKPQEMVELEDRLNPKIPYLILRYLRYNETLTEDEQLISFLHTFAPCSKLYWKDRFKFKGLTAAKMTEITKKALYDSKYGDYVKLLNETIIAGFIDQGVPQSNAEMIVGICKTTKEVIYPEEIRPIWEEIVKEWKPVFVVLGGCTDEAFDLITA